MKLPRAYSRFCVVTFAMLAFLLTLAATAGAAETVLYTFTGTNDGAVPQGLVADAQGDLYGANALGGSFAGHCQFSGCGNVFKLSPNLGGGWSETVLYNFTGGSDGAIPESVLIFDSAGNLYGTTAAGGYLGNSNCGLVVAGCGVVYKLAPNGDGTYSESVLHTFHGTQDGYLPQTGVVFDASGNLYGTANLGSGHFVGNVFQLSPNGTGGWNFKNIHSFTNGTDGGRPLGFAIDASGNLFGTTTQGGNTSCGGGAGCGSVVELSPNGSGGWVSRIAHLFSGRLDGAVPAGISADASGNLFGVALYGGHNADCLRLATFPGCGVVFELSPVSGGGWKDQTIYAFTGGNDGAFPGGAPAIDSSGNVYGTSNGTVSGCPTKCGAVYKVSPVSLGWSETTLYTFTGSTDGSEPTYNGVLLDAAGNVFGATATGGDLGCTLDGPPGCGVAYEITQ